MNLRFRAFSIFILILSFTFLNYLFSMDKTPIWLELGVSGDINLYKSNFSQLPGIPNCCPDFKSAVGAGFSIFGGIEYELNKKLFGGDLRIGIMASYNNLSANYSANDFFAHYIDGTNFTDAISQHLIEPNIKALLFEPQIIYSPFDSMPLFFNIGFQYGLLIDMTFKQTETLLQPSNAYFETGDKTRQKASGKLPNAASNYFALSIGGKYSAWNYKDVVLQPFINFNYGISNIVQSLNWTASAIRAGIIMNYNIPKPSIPVPMPPPLPELTNPKLPVELHLELDVVNDGKKVLNGSNIKVENGYTLNYNKFSIIPRYFYKKGEKDFPTSSHRPENYEQAQSETFEAMIEYLKIQKSDNENIIIKYNYLDDEDSATVHIRLNKFMKIIAQNGIDAGKFKFVINENSYDSYDKPLLAEEERKFEILTNNELKQIKIYSDTTINVEYKPIKFDIYPKIKSNSTINYFEGKVQLNNVNIFKFNKEKSTLTIPETHNSEQLVFTAVASAEGGDTCSISINLILEEVKKIVKTNENYSNVKSEQFYNQYILGYFEFNEIEFYSLNQEVIKMVKTAVDKGRKVTIYPLYDNIGSPDYNKKLAQRRAEAAIKALNVKKSDVEVILPDNYYFSNDNPAGRLLNRSVMIRIY